MIIDSMSIEEMQKEVKRDIDSLYTKIYYLFAENRRFFVKSKKQYIKYLVGSLV